MKSLYQTLIQDSKTNTNLINNIKWNKQISRKKIKTINWINSKKKYMVWV